MADGDSEVTFNPGGVSDLGDDIWRMTQRAYHDFDLRSQEQLALKHFV